MNAFVEGLPPPSPFVAVLLERGSRLEARGGESRFVPVPTVIKKYLERACGS